MLDAGKTQREVTEYFGLQNKYVVKHLLTRERRKERELDAGVIPRPKGRPRKDTAPRDIAAERKRSFRACGYRRMRLALPTSTPGKACCTCP